MRDGETVSSIDFALPKGAVIAVRLTDEFGEPVAGQQVQVQRFQWGEDGQRRLTGAGSGGAAFSGTDDRGEIRIFGLMPGEYVIEARRGLTGGGPGAGSDTAEGFANTFYPGTLSATRSAADHRRHRPGTQHSVPADCVSTVADPWHGGGFAGATGGRSDHFRRDSGRLRWVQFVRRGPGGARMAPLQCPACLPANNICNSVCARASRPNQPLCRSAVNGDINGWPPSWAGCHGEGRVVYEGTPPTGRAAGMAAAVACHRPRVLFAGDSPARRVVTWIPTTISRSRGRQGGSSSRFLVFRRRGWSNRSRSTVQTSPTFR